MPIKYAFFFCLIFIPYPIMAGDLLGKAPDEGYAGNVDFGFVSTTGNSETETVNGVFSVIYRVTQALATGLEIGGLSSDDKQTTTAERYYLRWNNRYDISDKSFVFGNLEYDDDRFSGFDYQAGTYFGYGYEFYKTDEKHFLLGLGAGYRRNELESGKTEEEAVGRASLDYRTALTEYAQFDQLLTLDWGQDRNIYRSESSISTKISENLSFKLAYALKYTSDVPPDSEKRDSITTIGVHYKF